MATVGDSRYFFSNLPGGKFEEKILERRVFFSVLDQDYPHLWRNISVKT